MPSTPKPTILFLNATEGCTFACLIHTLRAGYPAIALVPTPSDATWLLSAAARSLSAPAGSGSSPYGVLTVQDGDALDISTVKEALLIRETSLPRMPITIISGLGATPKRTCGVILEDKPTFCEDSATVLVRALTEIYAEHTYLKRVPLPLLCFISATGISGGPEDRLLPVGFPSSSVPRVSRLQRDQKNMENVFRADRRQVFRTVIGVRPCKLTDGVETSLEQIRAGVEQRPAVGYSISRKDVGLWIYKKVVEGCGMACWGEMVTLAI